MKCLKLNAKSTKAAQKAMVELADLGLKKLHASTEPLCVVFWEQDKTFLSTNTHEHEPNTITASSTEFFTKRKEFIAEVKRVLGESK